MKGPPPELKSPLLIRNASETLFFRREVLVGIPASLENDRIQKPTVMRAVCHG